MFLLPLAVLFYKRNENNFDSNFFETVLWLAIPVSIVALQCWMWLLKQHAVNASYWLFLCPVSGFLIAAVTLKEPLTWYTIAGVLLVITGLYLLQQQKTKIREQSEC